MDRVYWELYWTVRKVGICATVNMVVVHKYTLEFDILLLSHIPKVINSFYRFN